jgi:HD-GYP domain-containing protein (c-di-GMP phosphodiesterase class II)
LAARFAEALQMSAKDVSDARWAGRMHDLGKVVVDNSILHKDGALDEREWELMRNHPNVSADLLQPLSLTSDLAPAIRYHHERPDGLGYYGLTLENMPVEAAIITLADSYDAMTTNRPYRSAMTHEAACNRIEQCLGTQFHPVLGKAFVQMLRGQTVDPVELPRPARPTRRWFWQRVTVPTALTADEGWQPTSAIDAEKSSTSTHSLIP